MEIIRYDDSWEDRWDSFVMNDAVNGTFLQSRRFLNYHPRDRFIDCSLIVIEGNRIIAAVPACEIQDGGEKVLYSHKGSTFGGIVVHKDHNRLHSMNTIIQLFDVSLQDRGYDRVILKMTADIFSDAPSDLAQYLLFNHGYSNYKEISAYIDYADYATDTISEFNTNQKRNYKKALKNDLKFIKLDSEKQIAEFYEVLHANLAKYQTIPVHSIEELLDFKVSRLNNEVDFWGVYHEEQLVAGTMTFNFKNQVLHTQYLASRQDRLELNAMNYLYYSIIEYGRSNSYRYLSWGIATEDAGQKLNYNLLAFKEAFGSRFSINRTFVKKY